MSIRRTLLVFFLLMGLLPATILTGLAFFQARHALKAEINHNLEDEAAALMEQIDRMLFERLQNVNTWSHLEIMQEIRVQDVDKRLSQFLFDLNRHYDGVYKTLFCSNREGEIVAASNPAIIGDKLAKGARWLSAELPSGETVLEQLSLSRDGNEAKLAISAPIGDALQAGQLGTLHVQFDWSEIFRLLDKPRKTPSAVGQETLALVFDGDGRIIAASAPLRERGLLLSGRLASWRTDDQKSAVIADAENILGVGEVLVGSAHSEGYQNFPGFGWSVLVAKPTALAFAPVDHMALAFLLLLLPTSAAAVGLSMLIAGRIARPVVQLTGLTRRFMQTHQLSDPETIAKGEVGELTHAFIQMIHDLEKSRENLVRAAKLAVVGEMAATMAHEVRTPLGIMRSSTQMLQREPELSATGKEMLGFLLSETDRLNNLISALLECGQLRQPRFQPHPLHAIVHRVLDLLSMQAAKKNVRLETELQAQPDWLDCDQEQIVQVLLNLVMNAIQILPPGGRIMVGTRRQADGVTLTVDDDGPGVDETHKQRLFDPFFTQREGGIGLGLTVVQQIVRAHGAEIAAEYSPIGGARFRICFPPDDNPRRAIQP